jgi:hypothetical protein
MLGISTTNARVGGFRGGVFVPTVQRVAETIPRVEGKPLYTGTVRYVDGSNSTGAASNSNTGLNPLLPKLTITSAESASSDGGIVELISPLDLKNEASGYLLLNNSAKSILIRGRAGSPITVTHTGTTPTFLIRLRDTSKVQFQNINFSHNQTKELIYCECDSPSINVTKWIKLKDCSFDFQNAGVATPMLIRPVAITVANTSDIFFECDGCTLSSTKSAGYQWIGTAGLPTTATILLNNNTFVSNGFATYTTGDLTRVKSCLYENTITQNYGGTVLSFAADTSVPVQLGQIVDLRSNTITVGATFDPHGILFGRGTNSVYAVNNNVTIPTTISSLAIGFVIKTTSTNVGDSYLGGNYVIAPRPFYIKGASKVTATFNSCVANYSTRAVFDVDNPIETDSPLGINSLLNVITDNTFIGFTYGVQLLSTTATQKPATSMQGWTMDRNYYYGTDNVFLYDTNVTTAYYLTNRIAFWLSGNNDLNSKMLKTRNINQ